MQLLQKLTEEGHQTLLFSQSRMMLDMLEAAIRQRGWRFCRIDGTVSSAAERHVSPAEDANTWLACMSSHCFEWHVVLA